MSKRLQVVMDEEELRELREAAGREGTTVSEWVRRTLRDARRRQSTGDIEAKLRAIRTAAQYQFPTADIEQMNAEIEMGYREELSDIPEPAE